MLLVVLFRTVCVAMQVLGFVALGARTNGVGVIVSGEAGSAVAVAGAVGRARGVFVAVIVACGVWPGCGLLTLVRLACAMGPVLVVRWGSCL